MSQKCLNQKLYQDLVKHFGGPSAAARALCVKQGTASGWIRGDHGMSLKVALRAEKLTDGMFKAADLSVVAAEIFGTDAA